MQNSKYPKFKKSFTLIELLIAVFVFAITSVIVFAAFSSSISYQAKTRVIRETTQSARFFVEAVAREIRLAEGFRVLDNTGLVCALNTPCPILEIDPQDPAPTKSYRYDALNSKIVLVIGTDVSDVTPSEVAVSGLHFEDLGNNGIKITTTVKEKKFLKMAEKGIITLETIVYKREYKQ